MAMRLSPDILSVSKAVARSATTYTGARAREGTGKRQVMRLDKEKAMQHRLDITYVKREKVEALLVYMLVSGSSQDDAGVCVRV